MKLLKELLSMKEGQVIHVNFPTADKSFIVARRQDAGSEPLFWNGTNFLATREKAVKLSKKDAEKLYDKFAGPGFRLKIIPS